MLMMPVVVFNRPSTPTNLEPSVGSCVASISVKLVGSLDVDFRIFSVDDPLVIGEAFTSMYSVPELVRYTQRSHESQYPVRCRFTMGCQVCAVAAAQLTRRVSVKKIAFIVEPRGQNRVGPSDCKRVKDSLSGGGYH